MEHFLYQIAIIAMALLAVFGMVCRLEVIFMDKHDPWWGIMYICYGCGGAAAAFKSIDEAVFLLLAGCCLNLLLTRHLWAKKTPPESVNRSSTRAI